MKMEHRYEFIVNGEVRDRFTCDSQEELIKCIRILSQYQKKPNVIHTGGKK